MDNYKKWTETHFGQVLIAIGLLLLLTLICIYSSLNFFVVSFFFFLLPIGFKNPYVFCLIFFTLSVFRLHEIIPVLYPLDIVSISAILGMLSLSLNIHLGRIKIYWCKEMTYFTYFFIWVTFGVALSYTPSISFDFWSNVFAKIYIIFIMITWVMTKDSAYKLIILLIVFSGIFLSSIILNNLYQGKALIEDLRVTLGIVRSSIADPNDLALILLFSFSFTCSILINHSLPLLLRIGGLLSSIIICAAITATQSRGGLLGLVVVIGYFFVHRLKSKFLATSLFLVILFIFYILVYSKLSRFSGGMNTMLEDSMMGRINAWKTAINMFLHHPFFGVGLNAYQENYFTYAVNWQRIQHAAHSGWLQVLSESGFPGFALYVYCVYRALRLAHNNIYRIETEKQKQISIYPVVAQGLFAGLISFCCTSTFLSQGFNWPFYMFFALTIAFTHTLDRRKINL